MSAQDVQDLAAILRRGSKKESSEYIKKILSERKFPDEKKRKVWLGWLAGLESSDSSSMIIQLLEGMDKKSLKNMVRELRAMSDIVETQDPPRQATNDDYFREGIRLVREYKRIPEHKEKQQINDLQESQ